jgi:lipoprotein-releasing system permease protein
MAEKTNFNNKWLDLSFSVRIARRYLFSKKSHNAINIISAISALGVAIGTMALVVVLSVFNGFEGLISDMFSAFDPELRISLSQGKSFDLQQTDVQKVKQLKSIAIFTEIVEENALLRFKDKQCPLL